MISRAVEEYSFITFLAGEAEWKPPPALTKHFFIEIPLETPSFPRRKKLWQAALNGNTALPLEVDIDAIAAKFRFTGGQIHDALQDAQMINVAERELPPSPNTTKLFDKLFGSDVTSRNQVVRDVKAIFDGMKKHIKKMPEGERHKCGDKYHCKKGTPAYNEDMKKLGKKGEKYPPGRITLCPDFKDESATKQAIIIVHEGHHGTPGIKSGDYAYSGVRLITKLDKDTALQNAASFQVFVECTNNMKECQYGPEKPDIYSTGLKISSPERHDLDFSIGCIEQWLNMAVYDLYTFYNGIRKTRKENEWANAKTKILMKYIAPRFGLIGWPNRPTKKDQTAAAAIYDRINQMDATLGQQLTFKKVLTGKDSWQKGPGTLVTLTQKFFTLPPSRQTVALVQELVLATGNISARLEPEYVALIHFLREKRKLVVPKP